MQASTETSKQEMEQELSSRPVKVGVDCCDIGSIAGDIHAASLIGGVQRHVHHVEEQISNGEEIVGDIQGGPILNADAGLDGVHSPSQSTGTIAL